jgi:hypothetical protein
MFFLPKKVIKAVEQKLDSFLWKGIDETASGAKFKWYMVCKPKCEGDLGLRRLEDWNKAAIMVIIRSLFVQAGSLWVTWVRANLLRAKASTLLNFPKIALGVGRKS